MWMVDLVVCISLSGLCSRIDICACGMYVGGGMKRGSLSCVDVKWIFNIFV